MNGLLLGKVGAVLVVAGGSAGVTWAATESGSDVLTNAGPAAWIDDPLGGSVLPSDVDEVIVVAHATDPDGIVAIVLTVDGAEVDAADTGGDDLETADDLLWSPPGPGTYELRVIGRDPGGATTPPGIATVQVGTDEEQPTTTTTTGDTTTVPEESTSSTEVALGSTSTTRAGGSTTTQPGATTTKPATTLPTTTTTTTTRPCVPDIPVNTSPGDGDTVPEQSPLLQWSYSGCQSDTFRIEVSDDPSFDPNFSSVIQGTVAGTERQWTTPPLTCGTWYYFRVRAVAGGGASDWSQSTSFQTSGRCV